MENFFIKTFYFLTVGFFLGGLLLLGFFLLFEEKFRNILRRQPEATNLIGQPLHLLPEIKTANNLAGSNFISTSTDTDSSDSQHMLATSTAESKIEPDSEQIEISHGAGQTDIESVGIVELLVPFTPQAPFGNWDDPRQDYGCEEASGLMAYHWLTGKPLPPAAALAEITAMSDWELATYGDFHDSSAWDAARNYREYFGLDNVSAFFDIDLADIKRELAAGNLVIVPVDGQALSNPYFTPPGPEHHMVVVKGYDDEAGEFITNDPGTRRGEGFRYAYQILAGALRDYRTGQNEPLDEIRKAMIVIEATP